MTVLHERRLDGRTHPASGDLALVYDLFGLDHSHPIHVLLENVKNTKKFAALLHAVEREFFMVPGEPSGEREDDGSPPDYECLLNCWGSSPEQYIEQFRVALGVVGRGPLEPQRALQGPAQ